MNEYNSMSKEEQDSLGKTGSKISKSGAHLVTVDSMTEYDESRVKIIFKDSNNMTVEYVGFLTSKDPSKLEATVKRVMSQLTNICKAAGTDLKKVLASGKPGTETKKNGDTMDVTKYTAIAGKKLHIITYTEISADDKDANKAWANQVVNVFQFFDTKKRNGVEISADAEVGTTMETAAEEAQARFEINYKHTANKACITKLAQLQESSYVASGTTNAPTSQPESDDDI